MTFPVMLTFDLDAESGALAQDPMNANRPGVLSVGQYGPKVGVHRILKLLDEEAIPATFFIPGWVVDKYPAAVEAVANAGHEIAHHGYTHQPPATFASRDEEEAGLAQGIASIVRQTGQRPLGYRSPSWDFSPHTLSLLEQYGFLYSSNLMDDDAPYTHSIAGRATRLVELPIQWMNDDAPFFMFRPPNPRPIQPASHPFEIWTEELQILHREGKVFVLTMHPQIIGRPSRAQMLKRFIAFARSLGNVEFRRCHEVAADYLAQTA
ncbi:MAG: polysaccharide deacetylase [Chloroflexi bacterium]|nr:polysaccharide deacetylase [Chloroflexota bacterium]MBI3733053.1 polysaccharide deacetylase [Chloroflexota bacterium]